ncbi:hypothetical protein ACWC10_23535 [Streptomyces sp. NPDC001595]|uniref:hypothetical protein n=1 Tax=Streptomyces sp. NPDC001532 TaxID=3154520 RepID=UPI0033165436
MPSRPAETRLAPYARLPRAYRDRDVLHSTVDADGLAHWLVGRRRPRGAPADPYDAVVVTVGNGQPRETRLSTVTARFPHLAALPDGGFAVADARSRGGDQQVQVFDALGRPSWTFRVGDAIEHFLTDGAGDLWVGYFDEGVFGDPLSAPGVRHWTATGESVWEYRPADGADAISDCYALNVSGRTAWVCPYTRFPLLEIGADHRVRVRENPIRSVVGFAVHAERVVLFGRRGEQRDRLVDSRLTDTAVEPLAESRLVRPDGDPLGRRRVVSRGPRLYVQEEPATEWCVLDIG